MGRGSIEPGGLNQNHEVFLFRWLEEGGDGNYQIPTLL